MIEKKIYDSERKPSEEEKNMIARFLFEHLEQYGDPEKDILSAINFALKEYESFGGFVALLADNNEIVGATVVNKTGMGGYIPENILVYIAISTAYRGKGLGKILLKYALDNCQGDIALHVEHENPARYLYQKLGFENPYLEMRLKK